NAAIPSSSSLAPTTIVGAAWFPFTVNSSRRIVEYPGEDIPHHPGLRKADLGHRWVSFYFGKAIVPFIVWSHQELLEPPQASSSMITYDLAQDDTRKQPGSPPSDTSAQPLL
uniref:Uncharacterized protein n=1 Tax=Loxodonta africana TaxID=9785 RepID=G3U0D2_LOXAF